MTDVLPLRGSVVRLSECTMTAVSLLPFAAGTMHSRFLRRTTQVYELQTRDVAEHSRDVSASFVEAN